MKKIFTFLLAVLLVVALFPLGVQARTLTAGEKKLLSLLRSNQVLLNGDYGLTMELIAEAENYLASTDEPLTEEQVAMVEAEINAAIAAVKQSQPSADSSEQDSPSENEEPTPSQTPSQNPDGSIGSDENSSAEKSEGETFEASQWTDDTKKQVLGHIENAANAVGCKTILDTKGNLVVQSVQTGVVVAKTDKLVKVTGFGMEKIAYCGFGIAVVLFACLCISKKFGFFREFSK